jgi:hypothetical protein
VNVLIHFLIFVLDKILAKNETIPRFTTTHS